MSDKKLEDLLNEFPFIGSHAIAALKLVYGGANPHLKDKNGNTLLHKLLRLHAGLDFIKDLDLLIHKYKLDINLPGQDGKTPFHCLVSTFSYEGKLELMAWLIEQGAKPLLQTPCGCNALHFAASFGDIEAAKWLRQKTKLDPQVKTGKVPNPIDWARKFDHPALAQALSEPLPKKAIEETSVASQQAPAPTAGSSRSAAKDFELFKRLHELALKHSGIFSALKKFFSKMRVLLTKKKEPITTLEQVRSHATKHSKSRTAHILAMMRAKKIVDIKTFKTEYLKKRGQKLFSNPFETQMYEAVLSKKQTLSMDAILEHAVKKPDSLTAQVLRRYA